MLPRQLRPAAFALSVLAGSIPGQGEPGPDSVLVQSIVAFTAELPEKGPLRTADLERIEALTVRLPKEPWPELKAATDALVAKLVRFADAADADRYRSAYQRLATHPAIGTWQAGSLLCQLGEFEARRSRFPEAIASLQAAVRREPRLQFHVAQRLCRLEGGLQNYQAAREQLAIARTTASSSCADAMRVAQLEAFLRMREGLFDSAGIALERSRRLAEQLLAEKGKLEPYDELQQLLLEMDYAAFHQNLERAINKAEALLALPSVKPMVMVVERAELVKHFCRVMLGGEPDLPHLQRMFAAAVPANRDAVGSLLVEQALQAGAEDLATNIAAELLGGQALRLLSPTALVAVGRVELRPGRMPHPDSERWREWREALQGTWQRFLDEWRSLAPEAEGVAFLQMAVRRNVLGLMVQLRQAAGDAQAAAEAARLYLEVDALGSTARRLGIAAPTPDEVRRELVPAGGALLVCVPAAVGSFALWATPDGWHVDLLPPEGPLRQRVLALRQQAFARDRSESGDALLAAAEQLATGFGPAFRRRLAGSGTLVVAARDLLHGLPLELLPSEGPARWLGLDRPIVYLPSVAIGLHLVRRPTPAPTAVDVRVLAATSLGADDAKQWHQQGVEVSAAELEATVAGIDPRRVEIVAPAGVAELESPKTGCELLAVFAHGIFDGTLACPAGLLLGPDAGSGSGALFATAVPSTGLPRLLFLGVCGAARGALRLGEDGGNHLAVAFLTAGTDLVVSADGDVRLDEALALFHHFTDALAAGDEPAVALWRARNRAAEGSPHPGAWAGLRLEGRPTARLQLTPAAPSGHAWPWIAGAAAAFVVLALRRVRRAAVPPGGPRT